MTYKFLLISLAAMALIACGEKTEESAVAEEPVLDTIDQRLSYMVGNNVAKQFELDGMELDFDALKFGVEDISAEKESRLSQDQIQETVDEMRKRLQQRQVEAQAEQKGQAEKNKAEGEAFLAENKAKEGVVTTESGLQYKELTAGDGPIPTEADTVSVHYKGTLVDGTEFDSSYGREPATFPVTGVIPGWVEALQLMNVGDKWEMVIPSDLAYGPGGTPGTIGPNATLIFEVELLEIVKAE